MYVCVPRRDVKKNFYIIIKISSLCGASGNLGRRRLWITAGFRGAERRILSACLRLKMRYRLHLYLLYALLTKQLHTPLLTCTCTACACAPAPYGIIRAAGNGGGFHLHAGRAGIAAERCCSSAENQTVAAGERQLLARRVDHATLHTPCGRENGSRATASRVCAWHCSRKTVASEEMTYRRGVTTSAKTCCQRKQSRAALAASRINVAEPWW